MSSGAPETQESRLSEEPSFTTMKRKNILQKIYNHTKNLNKNLKNKTMKKTYKNCDKFCKKDYLVEIDKSHRKSAKKWNQKYNPTKSELDFRYDVCKKTFCNSKCQGYPIQINHKNGFQQKYTKPEENKLKERGALSACVHIEDYNIFH